MRTNIKVSLKETINNPAYDPVIAKASEEKPIEHGLPYNVPKTIDNIKRVDILLQGDTVIIQDIIKSIPAKYDIE